MSGRMSRTVVKDLAVQVEKITLRSFLDFWLLIESVNSGCKAILSILVLSSSLSISLSEKSRPVISRLFHDVSPTM